MLEVGTAIFTCNSAITHDGKYKLCYEKLKLKSLPVYDVIDTEHSGL